MPSGALSRLQEAKVFRTPSYDWSPQKRRHSYEVWKNRSFQTRWYSGRRKPYVQERDKSVAIHQKTFLPRNRSRILWRRESGKNFIFVCETVELILYLPVRNPKSIKLSKLIGFFILKTCSASRQGVGTPFSDLNPSFQSGGTTKSPFFGTFLPPFSQNSDKPAPIPFCMLVE